MPMRTPQLVAWQGGPKAFAMASQSLDQKIARALETLSLFTKRTVFYLENQLQSCENHNWSTDPFSEGAYSYIAVDGLKKSKSLARPVKGIIFFAGEATSGGAERGTIQGAMNSGIRAARQVIKSTI